MDRKVSEKTLDKYKLVVDQYFINGFNGTKAYQTFYPKVNAETAKSSFGRMITIDNIETYISEKHADVKKILGVEHEDLLNELKRWAYSNITKTILLTPKQVNELPDEIGRLVTKFKYIKKNHTDKDGNVIETVEIIELSFVSKERAMEMIHKHVGFYVPEEINVNPDKINALWQTNLIHVPGDDSVSKD